MNKPVRVILLDEADSEHKKLNEIVGQQIKEGKERVGSTMRIIQMKNKVMGLQGDECEIIYNFKTGFLT